MRKMLSVPKLSVPAQQAGAALPRDRGDPVFDEPWQAHTFAMVMSLYNDGHYSWAEWDDYLGYHIQAPGHFGDDARPAVKPSEADMPANDRGANYSRFLAECESDGANYYHLWQAAAEQLLDAMGLVTKDELEARVADFAKAEQDGPRFTAGQKVTVRDIKREGHTHLPLYLRGVTGEVESDKGLYVFPEMVTHGHDHGHNHGHDHAGADTLQHVYCITFAASDIWGEGTHSVNFNLWDYQLEPA